MSQVYDIGATVPDLIVTDADNMPASLTSQMGERGLLIYVLRGTWCAFCIGQIDKMRRRYPKYQARGVNTVFIVPEPQATVYGFAVSAPQPLPFSLHADEQLDIANSLTREVDEPNQRPIGIYLLSPKREVVWRFVGHEDEDFPSQDRIFDQIEMCLN